MPCLSRGPRSTRSPFRSALRARGGPPSPKPAATMASADFSLRSVSLPERRPFRREARSPQVRTLTVPARAPDLRDSPWSQELCGHVSARPGRPRLISGSCASPRRSRYTASFSTPLTVGALRFTRVVATNSPEDLHLQVSAHAGHTHEGPGPLKAVPALHAQVVEARGFEPRSETRSTTASSRMATT